MSIGWSARNTGVRGEPWAGLERSVDAAAELMTTAEAKTHLRVDTSADDSYIDTLVKAARMAIEERTSRATTNQTWVMTLDAFPCNGESEIRLPRPPLSSVTSITYVDTAGATQTWSSSNYVVQTRSLPGAVRLAYDCTWPATRYQPQAVTITYVAGYGATASTVPAAFLHAAKLIVGDLYENREGSSMDAAFEVNPTVRALLAPYVARYF